MKIVTMGSLYLNSEPLPLGYRLKGEANLALGNTVPGKAIQWIKVGDLLVADRCICTGVSWDDLNKLGYIFGNPVVIDGVPYNCRSLRLWGEPNEWDAIFPQCGVWHLEDTQFWGDGSVGDEYCATCSGRSTSALGVLPHEYRGQDAGFRPVLSKLADGPTDPASLVGWQVFVYGPRGAVVSGKLLRCDEYDFVLDGSTIISEDCRWAVCTEEGVVVDRNSVIWMRKA